jgi:serine/threonine-protein kinase RsbW
MAESPEVTDSFEAPVEEESLDLVQDRLATLWAGDESVAAADRVRFEMAVVEVVGNIVEHAFEHDADPRVRRLTVALTLAQDRVEAHLYDNGLPAEIDLGAVTMPDEDALSGRGLALAVAAVDEVGYERVDGRNHWRLLCRRTAE